RLTPSRYDSSYARSRLRSAGVDVRVAMLLGVADGDDPGRHHMGVADQVGGQLFVDRLGLALRLAGETAGDAERGLIADRKVHAELDQRVDGGGAVGQNPAVPRRVEHVDGRRPLAF